MGYVLAMGGCALCNAVFSFNPLRVPSIRIKGEREPVCESCMVGRVNPYRLAHGLEPVEVAADAYDGCDEAEL